MSEVIKATNQKELIDDLLRGMKKDVPVLVRGSAGVGKSEIIRYAILEYAKYREKELVFDVLNPTKKQLSLVNFGLPHYEAHDIAGIPTVITMPDGTQIQGRALLDNLPKGDGEGVLFLDEIGQADMSVITVASELIHERKINNDYALPPGFRVVGATNTSKHRAGSVDLPQHFLDRCLVIDYEPTFEGWYDWSLNSGRVNPMINAYLHWNKDHLWSFDPKMKTAQASPRAWERLSKLIEDELSDLQNANEETYRAIERRAKGSVGEKIAVEFGNFIRLKERLPNLSKIVSGDEKEASDEVKTDMGLTYAVLTALSGVITNAKADLQGEYFENCFSYVQSVEVPEIAIFFARQIVSVVSELAETSTFTKFIAEYGEFQY